MLKRLLVLAMVLAMAPVATANLTIGANGDSGLTQITIGPSEILNLDIRADGTNDDPLFMLVVDSAYGTIWGGAITDDSGSFAGNYSDGVPYYAYYAAGISSPWPGEPDFFEPTVNGVSWTIGYSYISGIVIDSISFQFDPESPGSADIELWRLPYGSSTWALDDELTVHQTPEPLTMALLGLGGLFLRRRK